MAKLRVFILISTLIVVGIVGAAAIFYARGYRLKLEENSISLGPTGLLVANSEPSAAQVYVDGDLKTATDNTISLPPGTYDIVIKKEGYLTWEKQIIIEKEVVTQIDAFLLPNAPSLTALSFSGAVNPVVSEDYSKIIYVVPPTPDNGVKAGLWLMEFSNLPLGFNREPKQITNGDLTEAEFEFSPDTSEVLMTTKQGVFLLDLSEYTPQVARANVASQLTAIRSDWEEEAKQRLEARVDHLPDEIEKILLRDAIDVRFSADDNRILYTASGSATIPEGLVRELPGSSTQTEERNLQDGKTYVYDIREDKNFPVAEAGEIVYWVPNSLNLIHPLAGKINVLDYDGTNEKTIFSGSYIFPHAYPSTNSSKLLLLTTFASADSLTNLYWLSLQ